VAVAVALVSTFAAPRSHALAMLTTRPRKAIGIASAKLIGAFRRLTASQPIRMAIIADMMALV
jgi:hypothetical protein